MGVTSSCEQVLERAKAEYGADNRQACSRAIGAVGGALGGKAAEWLGAMIGDKVFAHAGSNLVCH